MHVKEHSKTFRADGGEAAETGGIFSERGIICALLIVGAALIANLNVLLGDFVWDDRLLIVGNASIRDLGNWPSFFSDAFLRAYYRPVVMLSFAVEHAVYGLRPWGFHLTNLVLHIVNALLVFALLTRISASRNVALIAALLFAIHPAHKAVVTINDRTGLLAALFFLSALILYMKHWEPRGTRRSLSLYAASLIAFALGLLSKEEALTLPLVLIMTDSLLPSHLPSHLGAQSRNISSRIARYAPFFVVTAIYLAIRGRIVMPAVGMTEAFMTEPARRLMMVPSILLDYLWTLLFPVGINYDPRIPLAGSVLAAGILIPIILLVALAAFLPKLAAKAGTEAFATLWFFVTFIPMCNIMPIYPDVAATELTTPIRYLYLPSVGAFLLAGLLFDRLTKRPIGDARASLLPTRKAAAAGLCLLIFIFAVLSINRNTLWKDEAVFYRHVLNMTPENHKMRLNLGTAYMNRGRTDEAIEQFGLAITLAPENVKYRTNLARAYSVKGWHGRAREEFEHALRLDPDSAEAHNGLANLKKLEKLEATED
jgi:hypothetical protein